MVIREDRNGLIQCINEYINGKIKSFEFDEKLDLFRGSEDSTVRDISFELWFFYDDIIDHPVHATRRDWNYWQRLILILASGAEIEEEVYEHNETYTLLRLYSAILSISYFAQSLIFLPGCIVWHLLSFVAFWMMDRQKNWVEKAAIVRDDCYPFANICEIRQAVKLSGGYKKKQYPCEIEGRRTRSKIHEWSLHLLNSPLYFCLPPIFLLIMLFHPTGLIPTVKFPETPVTGNI